MQLSAEDGKPGYYLKFGREFVRVNREMGNSWTVAVPLSQATCFDTFAVAEHWRKLLSAKSKVIRYSVEFVDGKLGCMACGARVNKLHAAQGSYFGQVINAAICVECAKEALFENEHELAKRMVLPESDQFHMAGMGVSW